MLVDLATSILPPLNRGGWRVGGWASRLELVDLAASSGWKLFLPGTPMLPSPA